MNIITRRAALGGLALLTGGAATIAAAAPTSPPVDAELMQIGRELAIAEQAFHDACEAEAQAYKRWEAMYPRPAEIIVLPQDYRLRMVDYGLPLDPRDRPLSIDGVSTLSVALPSSIRVVSAMPNGRANVLRTLRRMLAEAEQWWDDFERSIEESGVFEAKDALRRACGNIDDLCGAAFGYTATSIEGVAVMLRAAVLSDLGIATNLGIVGDQRLVKLAGAVNAMAEVRS